MGLVAITNNVREVGMNFLNNAKKNMIDNFRSIKWLFHELEEVEEKVGQIEGTRNLTGLEKGKDQDERLSMVERIILNLENYNHNLSNQMISLLNLINENILSLTGWLKD